MNLNSLVHLGAYASVEFIVYGQDTLGEDIHIINSKTE